VARRLTPTADDGSYRAAGEGGAASEKLDDGRQLWVDRRQRLRRGGRKVRVGGIPGDLLERLDRRSGPPAAEDLRREEPPVGQRTPQRSDQLLLVRGGTPGESVSAAQAQSLSHAGAAGREAAWVMDATSRAPRA